MMPYVFHGETVPEEGVCHDMLCFLYSVSILFPYNTLSLEIASSIKKKRNPPFAPLLFLLTPIHSHHHPPSHRLEFPRRYYLNQGAQRWCETGRSAGNTTVAESTYCQWETWFISDVSNALELQAPDRVSVLFVIRASIDAVLVHFRIGAPFDYASEITVDEAAAKLLNQLHNTSSALFMGNVTVTVDQMWGLSGEGGVVREYSPYLPYEVR